MLRTLVAGRRSARVCTAAVAERVQYGNGFMEMVQVTDTMGLLKWPCPADRVELAEKVRRLHFRVLRRDGLVA